MKVTFNKHNRDKYMSQDRGKSRRSKKYKETDIASPKVNSGVQTIAKNSQRCHHKSSNNNESGKRKHKSKNSTIIGS